LQNLNHFRRLLTSFIGTTFNDPSIGPLAGNTSISASNDGTTEYIHYQLANGTIRQIEATLNYNKTKFVAATDITNSGLPGTKLFSYYLENGTALIFQGKADNVIVMEAGGETGALVVNQSVVFQPLNSVK
jgi:hypothetical protein